MCILLSKRFLILSWHLLTTVVGNHSNCMMTLFRKEDIKSLLWHPLWDNDESRKKFLPKKSAASCCILRIFYFVVRILHQTCSPSSSTLLLLLHLHQSLLIPRKSAKSFSSSWTLKPSSPHHHLNLSSIPNLPAIDFCQAVGCACLQNSLQGQKRVAN